MVKTDLEDLRRHFREKFREMGIEPRPFDEIASPTE